MAVVDDLRSGHISNLHQDVPLYRTDIAASTLEEVFSEERPEYVCHYAGQISVAESMPGPCCRCGYQRPRLSQPPAKLCQYGVRKVVYTSSGGAIYGDPVYLPCDEAHPVQPVPLRVSKYAVEKYLYVYGESFDLDYTILRLGNVYGPPAGPLRRGWRCRHILPGDAEGRPVVINGSGEQERDFLHVSDVAEASVRALETGSGKAFNIGTGRGSSVNHIFSLLKEITGYPLEAGYGPAKPGEVFKIYLDITGARQGLGWQPGFSLEDGLRNTVAWFGEASRE